jgi:hypothetical protein
MRDFRATDDMPNRFWPHRVAHGSQAGSPDALPWRGTVGQSVITGAGGFGNSPRIIATDKETGKVVWESSFSDTPDVTFTAAPLAIKEKIIVGATNGDQGVRARLIQCCPDSGHAPGDARQDSDGPILLQNSFCTADQKFSGL